MTWSLWSVTTWICLWWTKWVEFLQCLIIKRQYFQDVESLCGSHLSYHQFAEFFRGAPSVLLMVSLMLYAEGNISSLLLLAICYFPAYALKNCISSLGHCASLGDLLLGGLGWSSEILRQQLGRPYSLVMAGAPSRNLSAIWKFYSSDRNESKSWLHLSLRNILVCFPAKTQFIPVVPNSTAFFPDPGEPQHHTYASCKYNSDCLAEQPGSGCCSHGSEEN